MVYPHTYRTEHSETRTTNMTYGEYYAQQQSKKIRIQPDLLKLLQYCDSNREEFIADLAEAIAIKSISGHYTYMKDVLNMIGLVEKWMIKLGVKYECFYIGFHELEGNRVRLPPVILASIGKDPSKKTICIYGYLDVPFPNENEWNTDPWEVTQLPDKRLYGNGVASGKGSLICWFHAIHGIMQTSQLPVNLKFIIESMHHIKSKGLDDFLMTKKLDFLSNIDYVVMSGAQWMGDKHPCVVYGSVGIVHFMITVTKTENSSTDPKEDVEKICETFIDDKGHILIPDYLDTVMQISPDEEMLYEHIHEFDPAEIQNSLEPYQRGWDKVKLLMFFWRLPTIIFDETKVCTCEKKDFSIVKREVIMKIVPNQTVERIVALTNKHIKATAEKLNIKNTIETEVLSASRPWLENIRTPSYEAARRATIQIHKEDPDMIRIDRDYVVMNILQKIVEKQILLLPLGNRKVQSSKANESLSAKNYIEGTKMLGAYLFQMAMLG